MKDVRAAAKEAKGLKTAAKEEAKGLKAKAKEEAKEAARVIAPATAATEPKRWHAGGLDSGGFISLVALWWVPMVEDPRRPLGATKEMACRQIRQRLRHLFVAAAGS